MAAEAGMEDQAHGVAADMTSGEVDGAMKLGHLDHGVMLEGMEVAGAQDGEMEAMVEEEKRKDFGVEEEEEGVIHTNICVLSHQIY